MANDDLIARLRKPWFTNGSAELQKEAAIEIATLRAKVASLEARLECVDGFGESADGISCRDDTIALQAARIARLQADKAGLVGIIDAWESGLKSIASSHFERWGMDQTDVDEVPDHSGEEAMNIARALLEQHGGGA